MKRKSHKLIPIVSVVMLAALTAGSSAAAFLHHKQQTEQNPLPFDESQAFDDVPVTPVENTAPEVTPTDIVSPSDQPISTPAQPMELTEEKVTLKYVRIKTATVVRKENSTTSEKLSSLKAGSEVEYVSEAGSRYEVKFAGNKTGWVVKSCCELFDKEIVIRHIPRYTAGDPIDMNGTTEGDTLGQILKNHGTVGASVAVIQNGQVAYRYEYGYADKEKKVAVNQNTKFRIASATKVFTSMMAMRETDDGILDLDKDIGEILGFKIRHPSYPKDAITTRMLLTHTAGLVDREKMYGPALQVVLAKESHFNSKPGKSFLYSNLGMGVAGAVIEKSANQGVAEYARDTFFQPMGIDASFTGKYLSDQSLVANCYNGGQLSCDAKYLCRKQPENPPGGTYHLTAGGLLISAKDYAAILTVLLNNGQYNGQQYLSQKALDEMLTKQCETKQNFIQCIGIRKYEKLVGERDLYYHNGAAYGIHSLLALDMNDKSGVVVITSGASAQRNPDTVFAVCDDVLNYCYSDVIQ